MTVKNDGKHWVASRQLLLRGSAKAEPEHNLPKRAAPRGVGAVWRQHAPNARARGGHGRPLRLPDIAGAGAALAAVRAAAPAAAALHAAGRGPGPCGGLHVAPLWREGGGLADPPTLDPTNSHVTRPYRREAKTSF